MQSPTKKGVIEEPDSELERGELNFGRDDSERSDISEGEKVKWDKVDTKSLLLEIQSDLEKAKVNADQKDVNSIKRTNFEEIFEKMRTFCQNQLSFSFRDVEKAIIALINRPDKELSPLLKFYNELNEHSNLRLPVKTLLEFDTRLFRA